MAVTDEELREIYANAPTGKTYFEVIAIKASWFSQTYYLQNQVYDSIEITLEDDSTVIADYVPMSINQASSNSDLNYERNITVQEVNDVIAKEVTNFNPLTDDMPVLESRGYVLYRDGTISQLKTPVISVDVQELTRDEQGTQINATATKTDDLSTGEMCTLSRVPMLKGYLS